jgi:hypothetical protein
VQTVQARERVVTLLTRHFADDALSEAELEARLVRVYAAATPAELDAIVAELPVPGPTSRSRGTATGRSCGSPVVPPSGSPKRSSRQDPSARP